MTGPARRVVLFAREPVAGQVKTRLAREIGAEPAAALYGAFLLDLAVALPAPSRWDAVLAHAEFEPGPFLAGTFSAPWELFPQGDGSLGDRLARVVLRSRTEGKRDVVVAGSDAPTLGREDLESAFAALEEDADVVFAPAPDGGFSLVGVAGSWDLRNFFEGVRWSTAHALEDARRSAVARGARVALLATIPDVDELKDIVALSPFFSADPDLAPATRRALEPLFEGGLS
jgi:rSAM/selenodomain-associated transferase 1